MSQFDQALSREWGKKIRAKRHKCFKNALRTAALLQCKGLESYYVEGFLVAHGRRPILHAWCEIDGPEGVRVIELSPDLGRFPSQNTYFAARRFCPSNLDDLNDGKFQGCGWLWGTNEYFQAEKRACEFAGLSFKVREVEIKR